METGRMYYISPLVDACTDVDVAAMKGYIQVHLDEKLTPGAVAAKLGLDPLHARRRFYLFTDEYMGAYIRRLKAERAAGKAGERE